MAAAGMDAVEMEKRRVEGIRLKSKFPERVPVIVEQATHFWARSSLPDLERKRWLVPQGMMVHELNCAISRLLFEDAPPTAKRTIYLLAGRTALKTATTLGEVYEKHKNEDGFLYIQYRSEGLLG
mmetsp:Transcript_27036/g.62477  ORF Transcript_27036/g.62477 Transcript_27036/m.62477 type:complete len:125 (+) Transcript_27036:95-469(+)